MLTKDDVRKDTIIARRIKRMLAAELEGDDSDEEVQAPDEAQQVDGSDDLSGSASRLQALGPQQPPESSIVEDLGSPSDSEMSV